MITNSFVFLERIGLAAEQALWSQGINDWQSFINSDKIKGFSLKRKDYFSRQLKTARKQLFDHNSSFFNSMPCSEVWRLYDYFKDDCLFLDIETTGYYGDISVLGMFDGYETYTLVKDQSLTKQNVKQILSKYKLLVTFNGRSFDLPMIKRQFNISPNIPHLDLRFPLSKIGYDGGLKNIEKDLGIKRCDSVAGMSGDQAVVLWHDFIENRRKESLDLLVAYNEEDIVNLRPLADFVYKNLSLKLKKDFSL